MANEIQRTIDAYSNPLFRLGAGSQSPLEAVRYPLLRLTGDYQLLNSLYRNSWIVQNIITTIPDDMLRERFQLEGATPEMQSDFDRLTRCTGLRDRLAEGLYWGRLYGGAVGVMLLRGQDMGEPLDVNTVMPDDFLGLYIADRWSGVAPGSELVTDPADPDFGLPACYSVTVATGKEPFRVHHSRVVRFIGRRLPCMETQIEQFWGESELEAVYDDLVKRDSVSHNMAALTFKACRDYMAVNNLEQALSLATPQQKRLYDTLQAQSVLDSNFGIRVVDKDTAIHNTQYTFTGLSDVYEALMLDVSGAARIPAAKLFGRSPAGLNATGESDLHNYYDYVDALRESQLRPILERLFPVMALSCWGEVPDIKISFPPLWTPTAKEVAEIARDKTETVISAYRAGLLDVATAQRELKQLNQETGLFGSITDEEIAANQGRSYIDVTALADTEVGLRYGSDIDAEIDEGSGGTGDAAAD